MKTDPENSYDYNTDPPVKPKKNKCFVWTHGLLCFLIFVGGGALLGYSIYLQIVQPEPLPDLNLEDSGFLGVLLSTALAGIIVGAFMMVVAIVGAIATKRHCCGIVFAIIYTIVLVVLLAALIFIAVITLKFATDSEGQAIVDTARTVWVNTVTDPDYTEVACAVQERFNCMGFNKGDCDTNPPDSDVCPVCQPPQTETGLRGCYAAVVNYYDEYYAPAGIIASVFGGVVLADLVMVWVA